MRGCIFVLLEVLVLCNELTTRAEKTIALSGCVRDRLEVPLANRASVLTGQIGGGDTLTKTMKMDDEGKFSREGP